MLRKERKIFLSVITTVIGCLIITILPSQTLGENNAALNAQLFKAIGNGSITEVKALLAKGAEIEARDINDLTPLMKACEWRELDITRFLIEKGANVNTRTQLGGMPLKLAIDSQNIRFVELLFNNGANVNPRLETGPTPLMCASVYGNPTIVKFLIQNGAEVNATTDDGLTALFSASCMENLEIVSMLRKNGAKVTLPIAARLGDKEEAQKLLLAGVDVNKGGPDGATPLINGVKSGRVLLVKLLLEHGADIELQDFNGMNCLEISILLNRYAMLELFLSLGVDPDYKKHPTGQTLLMHAASLGNYEMSKLLIEAGANVNAYSQGHQATPLRKAVLNGSLKLVKLILDSGGKIDPSELAPGFNIINTSIITGNADTLKLLGSRYKGLPKRDPLVEPYVYAAAKTGNPNMVEATLDLGASIDERDRRTQLTPLMEAAKSGYLSVVKLLVNRGANIHLKTHQYRAIDLAFANGNKRIVDYLIRCQQKDN